jgi:hypothetical protein
MRSPSRLASIDFGQLGDDAQIFFTRTHKAPRTCPAQPPANIPGTGGKMSPIRQHARNEQWKALRAEAVAALDQLIDGASAPQLQADWVGHLVRTQMILIELLKALCEIEEPT